MRLAVVLPILCLAAVSACGDGTESPAPSAPTPPPPTVAAVQVDPLPEIMEVPIGTTRQLRALATFSDGSSRDVSAESTWTVVDTRVLTVDGRGLATVVGYGSTQVFANHRNLYGSAWTTVRRELGPRHALTGVVRDAVTGAPLAGVEVRAMAASIERSRATSDGNGYFDLGVAAGEVMVWGSVLGYAESEMRVPALSGPTAVDLRLTPNPGDFIERSSVEAFELFVDGIGLNTHRIVTRAGGVLDIEALAIQCEYNGGLWLSATSGGDNFAGQESGCRARLRFVVPASEVVLTVRGNKAGPYRLTFREPR